MTKRPLRDGYFLDDFLIRDQRSKPEDFAGQGEEFITNSTIRPDEDIDTREKYEAMMRERWPSYWLRFQYDNIVLGGRVVSSEEFGYETSNLPSGKAFGVAVYGVAKFDKY